MAKIYTTDTSVFDHDHPDFALHVSLWFKKHIMQRRGAFVGYEMNAADISRADAIALLATGVEVSEYPVYAELQASDATVETPAELPNSMKEDESGQLTWEQYGKYIGPFGTPARYYMELNRGGTILLSEAKAVSDAGVTVKTLAEVQAIIAAEPTP